MKSRCLSRGKASGRSDDTEEAVKQRLKVHHEQAKPILDYYERAGKLRNVSSEGSVEQAFADAKKHIDKYNSNFYNKNYSFWAYFFFLIGINIIFCVRTILFVRAHSFV